MWRRGSDVLEDSYHPKSKAREGGSSGYERDAGLSALWVVTGDDEVSRV
jgi:hypothetical protein